MFTLGTIHYTQLEVFVTEVVASKADGETVPCDVNYIISKLE